MLAAVIARITGENKVWRVPGLQTYCYEPVVRDAYPGSEKGIGSLDMKGRISVAFRLRVESSLLRSNEFMIISGPLCY
jgi:hypothetical protein